MRVSRLKPCTKCKGQSFVIDKHDTYRCHTCRVGYKRAARRADPSYKATLRAKKIGRIPKWLSSEDRWMIKEVYYLARLRTKLTGIQFDVDHVIPMNGKNVCGLHVPTNMQVITHSENSRKGNRYNV